MLKFEKKKVRRQKVKQQQKVQKCNFDNVFLHIHLDPKSKPLGRLYRAVQLKGAYSEFYKLRCSEENLGGMVLPDLRGEASGSSTRNRSIDKKKKSKT